MRRILDDIKAIVLTLGFTASDIVRDWCLDKCPDELRKMLVTASFQKKQRKISPEIQRRAIVLETLAVVDRVLASQHGGKVVLKANSEDLTNLSVMIDGKEWREITFTSLDQILEQQGSQALADHMTTMLDEINLEVKKGEEDFLLH